MKRLLAITAVIITLTSCSSTYSTCAGVDGGRPSRGCSR